MNATMPKSPFLLPWLFALACLALQPARGAIDPVTAARLASAPGFWQQLGNLATDIRRCLQPGAGRPVVTDSLSCNYAKPPVMLEVDPVLIDQAIAILAADEAVEDEDWIDSRIAALAPDALTARRLIDCLPEAFGLVVIARLGKGVLLPTDFHAADVQGEWHEFDMSVEPVFMAGQAHAEALVKSQALQVLVRVARRSSIYAAIDNLLRDDLDIEGAMVAPPSMLGLPAEIYQQARTASRPTE